MTKKNNVQFVWWFKNDVGHPITHCITLTNLTKTLVFLINQILSTVFSVKMQHWRKTRRNSHTKPSSLLVFNLSCSIEIFYRGRNLPKRIKWPRALHSSKGSDRAQVHEGWALSSLKSVQDFFIMLDVKPCMHLVEKSNFFSLNLVNCQTYKNYEQSRQKLGTISGNKGC